MIHKFEALGIMKIDVLALGMLTCIRKCFDLMRLHDLGDHDLKSVPEEDSAVYDMLCKADSVGVFTLSTPAAFRPSDQDSTSRDTRLLGAWIEPR